MVGSTRKKCVYEALRYLCMRSGLKLLVYKVIGRLLVFVRGKNKALTRTTVCDLFLRMHILAHMSVNC